MPIRDKQEYYQSLRANRSFGAEEYDIDRGEGLTKLLQGPAFEESFVGRSLSAMVDSVFWGSMPVDSTYDPYDDIIKDGLGGYADDLLQSRSYDEYQFRKDRIARSQENKAILADSGVAGMGAQMAWGLVDPVNFVPVFGAASKVYTATGSLAKAAAVSAAVGGVSQAGQEAVMSQIDPTYDPQAGMVNIGANALLSGILGPGMLAATSPEVRANFAKGFAKSMADEPVLDSAGNVKAPTGSVGAMRNVRGMTLDEAEIANTLGVHKTLSWLNRNNRLQSSPSERARNVNMLLNESALMTQGNLRGVATPIPVETELKLYQPLFSEVRQNATKIYMKYRESVTGKAGAALTNDLRDATGMTTKAGALTQTEFAERVAKAMRRGDQDIEGNEFVSQAAKEYRKFFDKVKDEAKRVGIWEDDPDISETAESYFSRVYEQNTIRNQPDVITEGIYQYYRAERDKAATMIPLREAEIATLKQTVKMGRREVEAVRDTTMRAALADAEQNMTNAVNDALAQVEVTGRPEVKAKTQADVLKKAAAKQDRAYLKNLQKELADDLRQEIDDVMQAEFGKIVNEVLEKTDEVEADDFFAFVKDDLLKPMRNVLGKEAGENVKGRIASAQNEAIVKSIDSFNRSVQAQLKRLAKGMTDAQVEQAIISKLKADIRNAARAGAEKAAREATKDLRTQLQANLRLLKKKSKEVKSLKWKAATDDDYLRMNAVTTVNRVQKSPTGIVQYDSLAERTPASSASRAGFRSSMKARALKIPDTFTWEYNGKKYSFEDFLVNDPDRIIHSQMRSVLPDIQLYQRFGRLDVEDIKAEVTAEYDRLITAAKTEKQKAKLAKQRLKDLKDLRDSFDILRGSYQQPDDFYSPLPTALRMSKQLNYLRLMGEMTVASFADVGSIVLSEGTMRTFGTAVKYFTKGMRGSTKMVAAKDELRAFITASESVLNSRFLQMADFDTFAPVGNKIEAAGNYASNVFQKITLMGYWLDGLRDITGMMVQDRIIAAALTDNVDNLTKGKLASSFIDPATARVIREQFKLHGDMVDGLRVPNLKNWDIDDPQVFAAFQKFRAAVVKDIDTTIIKPGSDKPTWLSHWMLSPIGQFKSFALSATHRILMKGSQRVALGDMQVISGLTAMIAGGMMSYWAKATLAGKEASDDPRVWLSEGIDRSGVLGILSDFNNMTEKLTQHNFGLRPMMGVAPATRYVNRNYLETLLGPTAGLVQDVGELVGPLSQGDVTQADVKKMRRMMPFQNALGVRYLYDSLEHGLVETFDVPQTRQ